jgi:hypothetical protein
VQVCVLDVAEASAINAAYSAINAHINALISAHINVLINALSLAHIVAVNPVSANSSGDIVTA